MRNRCILLVDDDDCVRAFIRSVLNDENYKVIDFADSEAALDSLPSCRGELSAIICDSDFARKLARALPNLPILMISGANESPVEEAGLCFLGKPFGPKTLIRALQGLINASRQLAEA